jgi:hypothetical protein
VGKQIDTLSGTNPFVRPTIWRFWVAKDNATPDSIPGQYRVLALADLGAQ